MAKVMGTASASAPAFGTGSPALGTGTGSPALGSGTDSTGLGIGTDSTALASGMGSAALARRRRTPLPRAAEGLLSGEGGAGIQGQGQGNRDGVSGLWAAHGGLRVS